MLSWGNHGSIMPTHPLIGGPTNLLSNMDTKILPSRLTLQNLNNQAATLFLYFTNNWHALHPLLNSLLSI